MALVPLVSLALLVEEENRRIERRVPRPNRASAFNLPSGEFVKRYRLTQGVVLLLVEKLRPNIEPRSARRNVLSVETQVLCALSFYATGSYQRVIGNDVCASICQQSVSTSIRRVTSAINAVMLKEYVKFPIIDSEQDIIKSEFFEYSEFPGVIGALDCTHVAILSQNEDIESAYVNRKSFHSINVQLICDMQQRILNVSARFPGSSHDAYIWRSSNLRSWICQASIGNSWLLGDSGYPLEPWLLTPIEGNLTRAESRYNAAHARARNVIERCNGTLKSRFRCLSKQRVLMYDPITACHIINACVVLHNMCIAANLSLIEDVDEDDLTFNTGNGENYSCRGDCVRRRVVSYFN